MLHGLNPIIFYLLNQSFPLKNERRYVYELIDPLDNEIRYIGKTDNLKRRFTAHISQKTLLRNKTHKNNWILSLLKKGLVPKIRVIGITNEDKINEMEINYIKLYREKGHNLTNMTDGGDGGSHFLPEVRKKISAALIGKKRPWSKLRLKEQAKAVIGTHKHTKEIIRFDSICAAARYINGFKHIISKCCRKHKYYNSHKNYTWEFEVHKCQ